MSEQEKNDEQNCIFCKIIKREVEAKIVYEDDDILCFTDINPQAPFHGLIIPKKHIPTINDAKEQEAELLGKLLLAAAKVAKQEGFDVSGYRAVFNTNKDAGQVVWHIHMHLLAGRGFGWPPG